LQRSGTRIEIKGVAKITWIPELTHNEAFRQRSLLLLKDKINSLTNPEEWKNKFSWKEIEADVFADIKYRPLKKAIEENKKIIALNLPWAKGFLSHFTQPERPFKDEITNRLKVIACLERPNNLTSEDLNPVLDDAKWNEIQTILASDENDAQILLWTSDYDLETAIETIEERWLMLFDGIPEETRKSMKDGTTIFERVLPGADRMYPDTDSAPISITSAEIENIRKQIPVDLEKRIQQLSDWKAPMDTRFFILRNNLMPIIERIINDFDYTPLFVTTIFGHKLRYCFGKITNPDFSNEMIYDLFEYVSRNNLSKEIIPEMLIIMYENDELDFIKILEILDYQKFTLDEILDFAQDFREEFLRYKRNKNPEAEARWIMGKVYYKALGNINLQKMRKEIEKLVNG